MQTLIILGHPESTSSHTQQFLKESIQSFSNVKHHILTDSVDIEKERALLKQADRLIFQFPVYWYSAPWQLKRWIDVVFSENMPELAHKELGIVASFGVAYHQFQAGSKERFTPSEMFRPFEMLANYFNMTYLPAFCLFQWQYQSELEKKAQLIAYQMYVSATCQQNFIEKGKWLNTQLQLLDNMMFNSLIDTITVNNDEIEQLTQLLAEMKQAKENNVND